MGEIWEKEKREDAPAGRDSYPALEQITGLDVEQGLSHLLNSFDSYIRVLKICCRDIEEQLCGLRKESWTEDVDKLRIYYHSLRGIFANAGAEELSKRAGELEAAALSKNAACIQKYTPGFVSDAENFKCQLEAALNTGENPEEEMGEEITEPEKYEKQLRLAREAVQQYNFAEITCILEELKRGSRGEKRELLKEALEEIGDFHYDAVMKLLERLAQM